jgi:hypothetical protein
VAFSARFNARPQAQISTHADGIFAPAIVSRDARNLDITQLSVKRAPALILSPYLQADDKSARDTGGLLEPLDETAAYAEALETRVNGKKMQVRAFVAEMHDGEAGKTPPGPCRQHDGVRTANVPRDACAIPGPR